MTFLSFQVTANQTTIEALEAENKTLKETVAEKDVRNADIMQQAKSRINNLTKFSKKQMKDNETKQKQIGELRFLKCGRNVAKLMPDGFYNILCISDEFSARVNLMESRIPMMEKENGELRAERDRLSREIELLTQRLNSIQRLHTQQVSDRLSSAVWLVDHLVTFFTPLL